MRRREFFGVLAGGAAWPVVARAQQGERTRRIGVLMAVAESDKEAMQTGRVRIGAPGARFGGAYRCTPRRRGAIALKSLMKRRA